MHVGFATFCFFIYIGMCEYAVGWLYGHEKHLLNTAEIKIPDFLLTSESDGESSHS